MNISFALTTEQFTARTKDVTRRLGWHRLTAGKVLTAIEKGQGLRKGEHPVKLGQIRTVDVRRERLDAMLKDVDYGHKEVIREGFPLMTPREFVVMFCLYNNCKPWRVVTRIEYTYL